MRIKINGAAHEVDQSITVSALIDRLGWDARKIAIERNLEIVPKSTHSTTTLEEGDQLEIVNFVGGG